MSLPDLTFSPGEPFSLERSHAENNASGDSDLFPGDSALEWLFRGIIGLALILLPLHIIISLLTSEGRQRLLADVIVIAALLLLATYLDKHPLSESKTVQEPAMSNPKGLEEGTSLPTKQFPADPPAWLALAVVLAVSALFVASGLAAVWFLRRRAARSELPLKKLAETAQNTIDALQSGGDLEPIIIRCYQEMSRVVKEQRGVARATAMTPREFEARLITNGLPQEAISALTRLFEQVRYGSISLGEREERLALSSLADIVSVCKRMGASHESL